DDPATELAGGSLGIDDAAAVIGAEYMVDASLAGHPVDAHFTEDSTGRMHRVRPSLVRVGGKRDSGQLVAPRPFQHPRVAVPTGRVGELTQPLVATPHLVDSQSGERRVL